MQPLPDDLGEELAYLRKREGFKASRLHKVPLVAQLLRQDPNETFERARSRFVSAIHSLGEPESHLLLDVFALSDHTQGLPRLEDRRRVHAAAVNRGIETIADREVPALNRLLSALVSGSYAQSPLTISVPEMHDGIIYETTSTMITVENRRWKHTREHYRFVAIFDEMDYLTITRSYPARAGVATNCAFRLNTREASHGFNDHFWHLNSVRTADEPMRRGESYDLIFLLQPPDPDEPHSLVNAYRAFHERSLFASIQVAFVGEWPALIWKYERVSHFAAPGYPDPNNLVPLDNNGVASLRLRDVHGGLVSGIAWQWTNDDSSV
jgi:hypothetical protein